MANTFTDLIPDAYAAIHKVSRELVGAIPAVGSSLGSSTVAVNQDIVIPIAPTAITNDITPSMALTDPADQVIDNVKVSITKSKSAVFQYIGEEQRSLQSGVGYLSIQAQQIAQAMRTLVNEVETDVMLELARGASVASGIAGTTPFAANLNSLSAVKKVLKDKGAPQGDLQMVMDTTAGANLYNLTQLTNANEAGDSANFLTQGMIGARPLNGFTLRESGNAPSFVAGTVTGATVTANTAVGASSIGVTTAGGGSVVLIAGQSITFAGDTTQYVVNADVTIGASTTGTIELGGTGLLFAAAATTVITQGAAKAVNVAFDRDAVQLIARPPANVEGGDMRVDSTLITDPISGLTFEISMWAGNRMMRYEVALAWGVKTINSNNVIQLLG